MKERFVCRQRIKMCVNLILIEIIVGIIFMWFIIKKTLINPSLIQFYIVLSIPLLSILFTIILFRKYLGRITCTNNKIVLCLLNRKYEIHTSKIYIVYINYEGNLPFRNKKIYSIQLREKGMKNIIPVKIMDNDVIKYLISILKCRKDPQDFMFDWER